MKKGKKYYMFLVVFFLFILGMVLAISSYSQETQLRQQLENNINQQEMLKTFLAKKQTELSLLSAEIQNIEIKLQSLEETRKKLLEKLIKWKKEH